MTQVDDSMEKDKYIVLLMDEMKIQADLVYDKHTGKITILCKHALCMAAKIGALIGFTNIGEVNNHLNDFERSLKEDNPVTPLATSMLVIMIRGLFSNISFPYAQFPCTELSGYHLYNIFWEAVGRQELCGFRVMGLICDGLSANRRLFRISSSETAGIPYKVLNPYSDNGRYIYFFSNPPHLMKTTRNAWASEKRSLWVSYTPSQRLFIFSYNVVQWQLHILGSSTSTI